MIRVTGPDGKDFYLIGLEFLSMPTALVAQIDAWINGGSHVLAEGV